MRLVVTCTVGLLTGCLNFDHIRDNPGGQCTSSACTAVVVADASCAFGVHNPQAPVVFFTDLDSGPNSGGENNLGAFITLYGLRFGDARGSSSVTIGGVEVASYTAWNPADAPGAPHSSARGLERIIVQPGGKVGSGDVVVTVGGASSNAVGFQIRGAHIFFVDPSAINGDGSVAHPFASLYAARAHGVAAGDIVYVKGGALSAIDPDSSVPNHNTNFILTASNADSGVAGAPIAYVGYPLQPPTLGGTPSGGSSDHAFWIDDSSLAYYTIANFIFANSAAALPLMSGGHRIIGNKFTAKGSLSEQAPTNVLEVWGNLFTTSELGFLGQVTHFDFGWNEFSKGGDLAFATFGADVASDAINIHDNFFDTVGFTAINLSDSNRAISIYNNIVSETALALVIGLTTATDAAREVQNNTFYHAAVRVTASGSPGRVLFENNIVESGPDYIQLDANDTQALSANHNLYFGSPAGSYAPNVPLLPIADARLTDPTENDFSLGATSPAIDAGASTSHCADYFGVTRPQGKGWDIGAIEMH